MNSIHPALLVLTGAVAAQGPVASPDPVYLRSEGQGYATSFGAFAAARYQLADANQRGSTLAVKSLFLRHDHRDYDVDTGMGREWSDLRVSLAECDQATLSTTFSANAVTTPTQVFSGAASWPIQLGPTSFVPALTGVTIAFSSPWSYAGTKDILIDATFTGGKLANAMPWSGNVAVPYYLDSFGIGSSASNPPTSLGHRNGGCVDSSMSGTAGAAVDLFTTTYGPTHANTALRDKVSLEVRGANFPPSTPLLYIQTFNGDVTGLPFPGILCNRIHVDVGRVLFPHPVTSNAAGVVPPYHFGLTNGLSPFNPAWAGVQIVTMAVWTDTQTGTFQLSNTSRISLLAVPYTAAVATAMSTVWDSDPNAAVAAFSGVGTSASIPILIYVQ